MKVLRRIKNKRGQAAIETGLALPFLIYLLYYTINAFHSIHTAQVGQRAAAMNLYQRLSNRAKFSVDSVDRSLHGRQFMGVVYTDDEGRLPRRRIVLEGNEAEIFSAVGVCKEAAGVCTPE